MHRYLDVELARVLEHVAVGADGVAPRDHQDDAAGDDGEKHGAGRRRHRHQDPSGP